MEVEVEAISYMADLFGGRRSERLIMRRSLAPGATVEELVRQLAAEFPAFRRIAMHDGGLTSEGFSVVVGEMVLELAGGWARSLQNGDRVLLLPAFSGGCR